MRANIPLLKTHQVAAKEKKGKALMCCDSKDALELVEARFKVSLSLEVR